MLGRETFRAAKRIGGSRDEALRVVRDALVANGFTVRSAGTSELEAVGPSMTSSKQNPIRGVSRARVRVQGSMLEMEADLGGVARLGWIVTIVPVALGLILAAVVWLRGRSAGDTASALAPLLTSAVWLIVGPLIAARIRGRTVKSVEALLCSAADTSNVR
jgi:hypothetical protein